ncbi:MAG: indole-3-glycerol-phosphate synthase, partial [Chloroflexota bacterium]
GALFEAALARGRKTVIDTAGDRFTRALHGARAKGRLAVIAEMKRVSPAIGPLQPIADVRIIAQLYEAGGAAAISVLTEPRHWGGSLDDLAAVREAVTVPVLRKDVIVDEYQVVEAWAAGADAVLLIAEALDDRLLHRLVDRALRLGIGVLVEAHEAAAFERAVRSGARVVGVNARDLRRPKEIRPERIGLLHALAHRDQILVAESGIATVEAARALPGRVDAVLVGTALMRTAAPNVLIGALARVGRPVGVNA